MKQHEVIISGIHMDLTDAIKNKVNEKAQKLFKHEARIINLKFELEYHNLKGNTREEFIATGHIEIEGPNIVASVTSEDLYKSLDILTDKLDRQLRRRSRMKKVKRKSITHADIGAEAQASGLAV